MRFLLHQTIREEQVNELKSVACWTTVYRTLQTYCRYKIVDNPSSSSVVQKNLITPIYIKKNIARAVMA